MILYQLTDQEFDDPEVYLWYYLFLKESRMKALTNDFTPIYHSILAC